MRMHRIVKTFEFALLVLIVVAGGGQAVMQLWNWLMPTLFKLPAVTFWQAFGLLMLARVLFGGFRGVPGYGMHWRMSPEQRERFRRGMQGRHERCGTGAETKAG